MNGGQILPNFFIREVSRYFLYFVFCQDELQASLEPVVFHISHHPPSFNTLSFHELTNKMRLDEFCENSILNWTILKKSWPTKTENSLLPLTNWIQNKNINEENKQHILFP